MTGIIHCLEENTKQNGVQKWGGASYKCIKLKFKINTHRITQSELLPKLYERVKTNPVDSAELGKDIFSI